MQRRDQRNSSMDILRLFACFLVVFLHMAAERSFIGAVTPAWRVYNIYGTAARSCVPLFMMLSGSLFLGKREMPGMKQLFGKYILKILILYLVWGLLYSADDAGMTVLLAGDWRAILHRFLFSPKSHLWYLPCLVGLYMMLPCMWAIARYQDGKYLGYTCLMFFVFGILRNTLFVFLPADSMIYPLVSRITFTFSDYCGYFLLGYYLSRDPKFVMNPLISGALAVAVIVGACWLADAQAVRSGIPSNPLLEYLMLPAFLEASLIFITFRNCKFSFSPKTTALLAKLSRATLFVYLFHIFAMQHLMIWFGIHTDSFCQILSVPVLSVVVYVFSLAVGCLLMKIPFVNKWLI